MSNADLITLVVIGVVGLLTVFVLPVLNNFSIARFGKERAEALMKYGLMAVRYAEQEGANRGVHGDDKKRLALTALQSLLEYSQLDKGLSNTSIEALVEAALTVFKQSQNQAQVVVTAPPTGTVGEAISNATNILNNSTPNA